MWNIFKQKFTEQYMSVIYYAVGLLAYTWLMIGMFPSMQTFDIDSYMQQMPKEFIKFFGGESVMSQYSKIEGFLSLEYLSIFFILIIAFYLSSSAGAAIAGNIEKKWADFDLSQPISRTTYILGQLLVGVVFIAALVIFNVFAIWALCKGYDVPIKNSGLVAFGAIAILFLWAFFGIAALISSISKTKISVILITVAFYFCSYVFYSLTNIFDKLKDYKKFSISYLYNPQDLLESGHIDWWHALILASIFLLGIIFSIIIFNKRDI